MQSRSDGNVKDTLQRLLEGLQQTLQVFKVFSEHDLEHGNLHEESIGSSGSGERSFSQRKYSGKNPHEEDLESFEGSNILLTEPIGLVESLKEKEEGKGDTGQNNPKQVPRKRLHRKIREFDLPVYHCNIPPLKDSSLFSPNIGDGFVFPLFPAEKRKVRGEEEPRDGMEPRPKSSPKTQPDLPIDQNQPKKKKSEDVKDDKKPSQVEDPKQKEKLKPKDLDKQQPSGSGKNNGQKNPKGCCKGCCRKMFHWCKRKRQKPHREKKIKHDGSKPSTSKQKTGKTIEGVKKHPSKQTKDPKRKEKLGDCCKSSNLKVEAFGDYDTGRKSPKLKDSDTGRKKRTKEAVIKIVDFDIEDDESIKKTNETKSCSSCLDGSKAKSEGKLSATGESVQKIRSLDSVLDGDQSSDIFSHVESYSSLEEKTSESSSQYQKKRKILDLDSFGQPVTADFVLIFLLNLEEQFGNLLEQFLQTIEEKGVLIECVISPDYSDIVFIKIQIPGEVAINLADTFDVKLACRNPYFEYDMGARYVCRKTMLMNTNPSGAVYVRNRAAVRGDRPKEPTSSEKIRVLYELLKMTKFSEELDDFGIWEMKRKGIIADAYPLHSGTWRWTEKGTLNERQLLKKYWASILKIFNGQPIQHICRYFGPEVAYYFAFMDWYMTMLIPAAVIGIITVLYGLGTMSNNNLVTQYCVNKTFPNKIVCSICEHPKICGFSLFDSCSNFKLTYLFDNTYSMWFGFVTSIWGILFLAIWIRQQNSLKVSWNLHERMDVNLFTRPAYIKKAQEWSVSPVTGEREPQVTSSMEFSSKLFATGGMLVAIFVVLLVLFLLILYRIQLTAALAAADKTKTTNGIEVQRRSPAVRTAALRTSILSSLLIIIFTHFFDFVAIFLTNVENPKTQGEYDRSYILKLLAFSWVNHYGMVFYLTFFRSFTYTHPGDVKMWKRFYGINADICDTSGCLIDVVYFITTLLIMKSMVNCIKQLILPKLCKTTPTTPNRPQWELDYDLTPNSWYRFSKLHVDSVTQYGLVIFFMPAFPLLPLIALMVNAIDTRVNAKGLVQLRRRPTSRQICERELWNNILYVMTFIGIIIHGFVAAFTTNYIEQTTFEETKIFGSNVTYLDAAFSSFPLNQYPDFKGDSSGSCLFPAKRTLNGGNFQRSPYYFQVVGDKLNIVSLFVGMVMIGGAIFLNAMPTVSHRKKQNVNFLENQEVY